MIFEPTSISFASPAFYFPKLAYYGDNTSETIYLSFHGKIDLIYFQISKFDLFLECPGSGRVTFSSHKSYMKAVNSAFVEIKTPKFIKKVNLRIYLFISHISITKKSLVLCRYVSDET
jgi:uncharacterized C2H2 Zn-finger protein